VDISVPGLRESGSDAISRNQVFVCYSHQDIRILNRLMVQLRPLERKGVIDLWSDRRSDVGNQWRKEIDRALARAGVALLLVSSDFLASDFIQEVELPALLAAAEEGGCRVIPILVGPSIFSELPSLARFQQANQGATTLLEMERSARERQLADIARNVLRLCGGALD
jgi:hypothetical protein